MLKYSRCRIARSACLGPSPRTVSRTLASWNIGTGLTFFADFWASILSLTLPSLLDAVGSAGTYFFYAGLNVVAFILIFLFLPETKLRTLEELDYVFGVSTRRHAQFQMTEQAPWWFKRWVFMQKGAPEPQLYRFTNTAINAYRGDDKGGV